jgi:hypothetical protein
MPTNEEIRQELRGLIINIDNEDVLHITPEWLFSQDSEQKMQVLFESLSENIAVRKLVLMGLDCFRLEKNLTAIKKIAEALKVNKSITHVDLSVNNAGIQGMSAIAEALKVNKSITHIGLSNNKAGPQGMSAIAEALKVNKSIAYIDLSVNEAGIQGMSAIAEALKINKSIADIGLDINGAGIQGTKAIADALKVNKSITTIGLFGNHAGPQGKKAIADALTVNNFITHIKNESGVYEVVNKNLEFLDVAEEKFKANKMLDIDEIYALNLNNLSKYDNFLLAFFDKNHESPFKINITSHLNILQNHLGEHYFSPYYKLAPEFQLTPITKALAKFNGFGFLYKVGEYLTGDDIVSLHEAFLKVETPEDAPENFSGVKDIAYQANLGIKALDTAVDTLRFLHAPSFENWRTAVLDVNHLAGMYYGSNVYFYAIMASDVLDKAYEGKWYEAAQDTALSVAYLSCYSLLMSNAIIAEVLLPVYVVHSAYHLAANAYDLYQEVFVQPSGDESTFAGDILDMHVDQI